MQCSHAYRKKGSKYIYCDIEGCSHGSTNAAISPYLCIYQEFPPYMFGNEMNLAGWENCPKIKESEDRRHTVLPAEWAADVTYSDYPYRAAIAVEGATPDNFPYVEFEEPEQESGNYADVCLSYDGGVYIFCKTIPDHAITVSVYLYVEEESDDNGRTD